MTTSGAPGNVKPATFQPGAVRWSWYQIEGMLNSRCLSLASNGFPVAVCAPLTTQLLLPNDCLISRFVADRKSRAAGHRIDVIPGGISSSPAGPGLKFCAL